jgi:hypothetical protein
VKDLDALLKDIDALVDWQLTESPAAQAESLVYCDDDDGWTPEDVAEYTRDHPTVLKFVTDGGIRVFGVECRCVGDVCKYVGSGE